MNNYSFFDVHSHLHDKAFNEDRDDIIAQMKSMGVGTICVGTDVDESRKAVELAQKHELIYATVGLHPADNPSETFDESVYEDLAKNNKVVAIGECGLDYFRLKDNLDDEKNRQKDIFKKQIKLAVKLDKPLMLHGRPKVGTMDAYDDMLEILEDAKNKHGEKLRGNAHFFVGNIDIAERFLNIGFTMSFSGVITFTQDYDDVVRFIPLDMMHAETDSPYATPAPFRGKRNNSQYVQEIVARIAVLRHEPLEEVRRQLLENARKVFNL